MKRNVLKHILDEILATIFPQEEDVATLEALSPSEFLARAAPPCEAPPDGIHSVASYKSPLAARAIWELKYRGNRRVARLLAELMADIVRKQLQDTAVFESNATALIIPIPLSRERRAERGWNQSEMLAREIGRILSCLTLDTESLQKIRHTSPQTKLGRKKRLENLRGAFVVTRPRHIANKHVILIDDVVTTGSTLLEARGALGAAGAASVTSITVAH